MNMLVHYHNGIAVSGPASPELFHRIADAYGDGSFAYFAAEPGGHVKIGWTKNPRRRIRQLRSDTKLNLQLLATRVGGRRREFAYHMQFKASRLHGEWFERTPELLAEIDRLNTPSIVNRGEGASLC